MAPSMQGRESRRKRSATNMETMMGILVNDTFKRPPCRRCRVKATACVYTNFGPDAQCERCLERNLPCPKPRATEAKTATCADAKRPQKMACNVCRRRKRACGIGITTADTATLGKPRPNGVTPDGSLVPACDFCVRHNVLCEYPGSAGPDLFQDSACLPSPPNLVSAPGHFVHGNNSFVHQSTETSVAEIAGCPQYVAVHPGFPSSNMVAPVPMPLYPFFPPLPVSAMGTVEPVNGLAPFHLNTGREVLLVSPDLSFGSQPSVQFQMGATLTELVESNEDEWTSRNGFGNIYQGTADVATAVWPRSAINISEFPSSDLEQLPEPSVMNYYVREAFKTFFPHIVQIFAPSALADLRRRSPLLLWAIALTGAAFQGDTISAKPFLQRISRIWSFAKNSDGSSWDLVVNHPYGQTSLPTIQTLIIMLVLLSSTWADKHLIDREKTLAAFYRYLTETFIAMKLGNHAHDTGTRVEREERRRTAIISFAIEQWASLFMFKKPTAFNEELLHHLRPDGKSPAARTSPEPASTGASESCELTTFNHFSTSLRFDKDVMLTLVGQVADFQALGCCVTGTCESCGPRRVTILAKFDAWFGELPPWVQDFDLTGELPDAEVVQASDASAYLYNVGWVGTMLQVYHAGVLNLLRPRKGSYTLEWCGTEAFVTSTEHAIRTSSVLNTLLELSPTFEFAAPFTSYSLLQTALVHRCYIDSMKTALDRLPDSRQQSLQVLLDEAQGHLGVVLKALEIISKRWVGGEHALAHYNQNIPF